MSKYNIWYVKPYWFSVQMLVLRIDLKMNLRPADKWILNDLSLGIAPSPGFLKESLQKRGWERDKRQLPGSPSPPLLLLIQFISPSGNFLTWL